MDVKRRSRPSGSQLLDEQELSAGLLGGGFHGHQHPEKPQCLSILRAKRVGGGVSVHKHSPSFLPLFPDRYLSHRYDAIQRTLAHMLQRLAMILTHATSLFGLLHPIASTVSHGRSPE